MQDPEEVEQVPTHEGATPDDLGPDCLGDLSDLAECAEAILKLRALTANGDFDAYWRYHLRKEHERIHGARYRESLILAA